MLFRLVLNSWLKQSYALAAQVTGTIGIHHHAWLVVYLFACLQTGPIHLLLCQYHAVLINIAL
jgi:hypothetical protein